VTILRQALRLRRLRTAAACIHELGEVGGMEVGEMLVKVVAREQGPLAVAAARALGRFPTAESEQALLGVLAGGDEELTTAAIVSLGRAGTARAVLPIQDAASRAGAGVRRAARQSVAEIQSRLPGATPGQLSLAGGEAGRLTLADEDPRGRVSLAP
jgi:HEAT repeat protein